ncbi:MAG: hypothetical protein R3E39_09645 [Anaerolineae bacterium]
MVATVSGSLFANADNSQSNGWLYQNLGKEGASIAAFVLFAVLALVGGFLTRRLIQKLGQMYEDSTR